MGFIQVHLSNIFARESFLDIIPIYRISLLA